MRKKYDFSKGRKNPYAKKLKKQITIRLDDAQLPGPPPGLSSERPSFNARHYHGTIGMCDGPVSCSALLGGTSR